MNNRVLNTVAGRLSLRAPQRESLEALQKAITATPDMLHPKGDTASMLEILKSEFPKLSDFEREFPSLCFALATGVGKTRLMGAFISYLHSAHGISNFFVLAPNLTIYNKLIADFTPNTHPSMCQNTSEYLLKNAGKAWKYLLIPHDEVKENFQLEDFSKRFQLTPNHCN